LNAHQLQRFRAESAMKNSTVWVVWKDLLFEDYFALRIQDAPPLLLCQLRQEKQALKWVRAESEIDALNQGYPDRKNFSIDNPPALKRALN